MSEVAMHPHDSSAIYSSGFDPETNELHIRFHSSPKVYRYGPFEQADHDALKSAASAGQHFHQNIRGKELP